MSELDPKIEIQNLSEQLATQMKDKVMEEVKPLIAEVKSEIAEVKTKAIDMLEKQTPPKGELKEYQSFGEFAVRVAKESPDGHVLKGVDLDYQNKQWDFQMDVGVLGGLIIPERWRTTILDASKFTPIVRNRATVIPSPDPKESLMHLPAIAQAQDGTIYDMEGEWIGEAEWKPRAEMLFEDLELKPFEYAMYWVITNKLLRNGPTIEAFLSNKVRRGCARAEDRAFFNGNGITQPTGFLGCSSEILVPRTGPGAIIFADILNMYNATIPEETGRYVWFASASARADIIGMVNAAGFNIFMNGDVSKGIPNTLFGLPIIFTERCAALGSPYDITLTNLDYYLILDGAPLELAFSTHYRFRENKTCYRASFSVDGMPWLQLPILLEDAVTLVSPFVALQ